MQVRGIITKIYDWIEHPIYAPGNIKLWLYGLAFILILSFLWATVVHDIVSDTVSVAESVGSAV